MDSCSLSNLEESRYEPRKRLDETTKLKALEIFKNPQMKSVPNEMIAVKLGLSARKINSMKRQYMDTGDIKVTEISHKPNRENQRLTDQNQLIRFLIQKNRFISARQILGRLREEGHNICLSSLFNRLNQLGYHFKRDIHVPETRNTSKVIDERYEFSLWINQVPDENIFYSAEARFDMNLGSMYGWMHKNQAVNEFSPEYVNLKHSFLVVYLSVGCNGIVGWKISDQREDAGEFIKHIGQTIAPLISERDVLLLDPNNIHDSCLAHDYFETQRINSKFIPHFSACLNPVYQVFNLVKTKISKKMRRKKIPDIFSLHKNLDRVISKYQDLSLIELYLQMRNLCEKAKFKDKI